MSPPLSRPVLACLLAGPRSSGSILIVDLVSLIIDLVARKVTNAVVKESSSLLNL